ncbi:hypothetical protein PF008_g26511 [Phytophthora fragariae]|uniref:Transmembrane protein n=1 Tax=Phytophthora fragariae TaxID=53985 RepID=A0A6G0QHG9_9STRA|nr:hypothetical protein PF008_g26511 [Phytophthora fragariae]
MADKDVIDFSPKLRPSISQRAFSTVVTILLGSVSHNLPIETHTSSLINAYAGTTTIQESPLVQQVLQGSTSPRNDSLFLLSETTQSSTGCLDVLNFDIEIYSNEFLRFAFSRLQMHAAYNLSYVSELELVAPVVDCTFTLLTAGDRTAARVYYLTRRKSNQTDVFLLSTSLSVQDYEVEKQYQKGPGTIVSIAAINDMRATVVNHHIAVAYNYPYVAEPVFAYSELMDVDSDNYWVLRTLPNTFNQDPAKFVRMARRFGRYVSDSTAQSNIETAHLELPSTPAAELGTWMWHSRAVLHDSWAWTQAIHGVFALNVIFNLSVLAFVMYRRMIIGHFWVGDAFSTISSMLLYRGLLVMVCNHMNGYWTVTKMCISVGDSVTGLHAIYYRPELVHADLLAIFLNVASILSYLARERVDPILVFATFELGWGYRVELVKLFPELAKNIVDFAVADATNGLLSVSPELSRLSPMQLMTAYAVEENRRSVVASTVVSIFSPIVLIAAYIMVRKAVRAYTKGLQQIDLTSFETATGAALSRRFGVISGYDNYIVSENQLTATIDAVYGNGFLVVKKKFLISAQDLLPLVVMKLTRVRFTNIFVYEIMDKSSVGETARLVYPSTISWSDLRHLDVTTLT